MEIKEKLFMDEPEESREQLLYDNCIRVQEEEYNMPLTAAEKKMKSKQLLELTIKMRKLAAERKQLLHELKEKKDDCEAKRDVLIDELQQGGRWVKGKVYIIADREKKMVGKYDKFGNLLEKRKMQKEDMQISLNEYMGKSGTDDL